MMENLVQGIINNLAAESLSVVFAESCTAGLVSDALARVSGASRVFWGSFVTYSIGAKMKILGIEKELIETYGAVSRECALAMAQGALAQSGADIALSVTGLAGPDGDGSGIPVGTVWIGWAGKKLPAGALLYQFSGSRNAVREAAAENVIKQLSEIVTMVK